MEIRMRVTHNRLVPGLLAGVSAVLLGACAGSAPRAQGAEAQALSPGRPDGPPKLSALPSLPRGEQAGTERTRQGLLVMREAFDAVLPESPAEASYDNLQHWVDGAVVDWIGRRNAKLEQARFEFGVGREPTPAEHIVALAATGLLQEDTARQLATIPSPAELQGEPMVQEVYRDVIRAQARPFLSSALVRYRECADEAHDGPEALRHWAGFCDGRFQRLKQEVDADQRRIVGQAAAGPGGADGPSGSDTTVVVVEQR